MSQNMASEVAQSGVLAPGNRPLELILSPAAKAALAAGVPESTRAAYAKDFKDWYAEVGRTALPATAEPLTEYATHLAYGPEGEAAEDHSRHHGLP